MQLHCFFVQRWFSLFHTSGVSLHRLIGVVLSIVFMQSIMCL